MTLTTLLIGLALAFAAWGIVTTILIANYLSRKGVDVSYLFLRVLILKYLGQYRDMTLEENGKIGPLFYSYIIAMNLALLSFIGMLFTL
jgi:hypothetical protein